jgi:probable O-glycosylation ligase (exosortase A-associated)
MRDIAFLAALAIALPFSVLHPWIGIMVWNVISIMNPHRYLWTVSTWPLAAVVAGAIFLGLIVTKDRLRLPVTGVTVVLALFSLWMCATYPFSIYVAESWPQLTKVLKIQLMIFVSLLVLRERRHLEILVWVIVVSLGFYGVKGGVFTLLGGAEYRVWGPPGTFIEDNNELALALLMTIPLMRYLQLQVQNRWAKLAFYPAMVLCALSALGSHSRGALVALAAVAFLLWLKSRHKLASAPVLAAVGVAMLAFMPEHWWERMTTITEYQQDASAMGRLNAWTAMFNIAKARVFGGGFYIYRPDVFAVYAPDPNAVHAAHSIYFQVMGEHGFVGLAIFLLVWLLTWRNASWVIKHARRDPATEWAATLAGLVQVSLAAYLVGGNFYSLAYFDLPYNLLVLVVIARRIVEEHAQERTAEAAKPRTPAPRGVPVNPPSRA